MEEIPGLQAHLRQWIKTNEENIHKLEVIIEGRFKKGSAIDGVVIRADHLRVQIRDVLRLHNLTEHDADEIPNCDCED